jgi:hypothetical protein
VLNFGRLGHRCTRGRAAPLALLTALVLAGCAELPPPAATFRPPPPPPPPPPQAKTGIVIQTPFRADDFAWSVRPGAARIQGLTAPGESCAGKAVALTPDTPYSSERILALYGSDDYAVRPAEAVRAKVIVNDNPAMRGYVRSTRCDSSGVFLFDKLPAGPYYIIAEVGAATGDKVIMRRVTAVAGRTLQAPLNGGAAPPRLRRKPPQG